MKVDGVEPPCFPGEGKGEGDAGCPVGIDSLGPEEKRALELRAKLITLKDLVGPEAVLRIYDADEEDLEMLKTIEEELKELKDLAGNEH